MTGIVANTIVASGKDVIVTRSKLTTIMTGASIALRKIVCKNTMI